MKKFKPQEGDIKTSAALDTVNQALRHDQYAAYIGLDVHKETIAVAVAEPGRGEPQYYGEYTNTPTSVEKLVKWLIKRYEGELLLFSYEAGPCGYVLYHQLIALGMDCEVVAPSLIPQKPGGRVKTDKRDAIGLARHSRSGELTRVWVPDEEQESMRDLTRAREDIKKMLQKAQQQLGAFLLRHGQRYDAGKTKWTKTYFNWLEAIKFESPIRQIVLQEYIDTVKEAQRRIAGIDTQLHEALTGWGLRPTVEALVALRGVDTLTAVILLSELGDISRFDSPKQLMAYLGLVPGEHSSGPSRKQLSITKAGNTHARRLLVESAWSYRHPARKTAHLRRKASKSSGQVQAIAWEAQKRLCGRYRKLMASGKDKNKVTTAIARELAGFIWAIVCEITGKPHGSRALA